MSPSLLPQLASWLDVMVNAVVDLGLVVTALGMFLCLYRLVRGPHISDRSLAVDTLGIHLIALVILLSFRFQTLIFFDGILVLSLVGFAGGVAMAQYIGRPHLQKAGIKGVVHNPTKGPRPEHTHP
jgi:multisubunit Na+/H+ antiporter MnhF subunit